MTTRCSNRIAYSPIRQGCFSLRKMHGWLQRRVRPLPRLGFVIATVGGVFAHSMGVGRAAGIAPDTMKARVGACTACHGAQGGGVSDDYIPRLAGKPAGYLDHQLLAFRSGKRRYTPMNYLLEFQSDAYLQAMADYFAAQHPPALPPAVLTASQDVLAAGRSLVMQGDPTRRLPACSRCHGPTLTGMQPAIPGLLGLNPSYVISQLGAWRYGTRTAAAPDCMQVVAGYLTEADGTALGAYLSSLPSPNDPAPLPHGTLDMPLACGSEPR